MTKRKTPLFLKDMISFPRPGRGVLCVWRRNFLYFRQTIFTNISWIFVEPLLYLFALGYGLGRFVTEINGQSYAEFIAPAMMATSGMFVAFFEGSYSTYTKLSRQHTYQTIILTPISTDEIVIGEILWCTSKAFLSVMSVALVMVLMGLVPIPNLLPVFTILFLMCWCFSAFAVWISSIAKSYEWFSYSQSGFITPMSLFCGTYFPLSQLPKALIVFAYFMPLTHALKGSRMVLSGRFEPILLAHIAYLILIGLIFTNLSAARFERKLIL